MNYRVDNGLQYQDPAIDILVGSLRMAIQHEDGFDAPSDRKLSEFFNFDPTIKIFRKGARSLLFQPDHVHKLVYGLYRRSSAQFILNNFGKPTVLEDGRTSIAVRKALLAINKYCGSKGYCGSKAFLLKDSPKKAPNFLNLKLLRFLFSNL